MLIWQNSYTQSILFWSLDVTLFFKSDLVYGLISKKLLLLLLYCQQLVLVSPQSRKKKKKKTLWFYDILFFLNCLEGKTAHFSPASLQLLSKQFCSQAVVSVKCMQHVIIDHLSSFIQVLRDWKKHPLRRTVHLRLDMCGQMFFFLFFFLICFF